MSSRSAELHAWRFPVNERWISAAISIEHARSQVAGCCSFDPWPGVSAGIYTDSGDPVGGVGVSDTFTFTPPPGARYLNLSGYRYSVNGGPAQFLAAGSAGTATLTWAPDTVGYNYLEVFAVAADGTLSDYENFYGFTVAG